MLFFGVFLRETARPVAKSRTNVAQIQESYQTAGPIDTKFGTHVQIHLGMIRLAPNFVHMCRLIWECIYAKQIAPRDTRGTWGGGGFRGSNIQKSREAVKRLDRLAPTLVHVGGFIWEYKYNSPAVPTDNVINARYCNNCPIM